MVKKANQRSASLSRSSSARRGRTDAERAAARRGSALTRKRTTSSPAARGGSGQAQIIPLPMLGQQARPATEPAPVSTVKQVSTLSRWLWRHRWPLTPPAASVAVMAGAASSGGASTALVLAGVGAGAHALATRGPDKIGGRVWLSRRERGIAASWAAGGAVWAMCVEAGIVGVNVGGSAALAILTGYQGTRWVQSRRGPSIGEAGTLSGHAAQLVAAWPNTIGLDGPDALRGSRIVPATVDEPAPGALTFAVELRGDVHGQDAVTDTVRRRLERALCLGIGTVELAADRENSALVRVTLTPTRHLELAPAGWAGPVLNEDGTIPLADERSGAVVDVALFNEAGTEHGALFGTSGAGKSNTLVTLLLPGVAAGLETVWYIDGGQGTSAGHLAGACDWWAVSSPTEWEAVIEAAHAVMRARKARRAALGLSAWRGRAEPDPILTLSIDEATTVKDAISKRHADMVAEMLREGRKLGVRVIQSTQDPMGDGLIGGRVARGLMAGAGALIAHRPGDGTANVLSGSSTSEQIDLRALPPEPGWVGIIRRGKVLARAARVRYATPDAVHDVLATIAPRTLAGADLAAAGPAYRDRVTGPIAAAGMRGDTTPQPTNTAQKKPDTQTTTGTAFPAESVTDALADVANTTARNILLALHRAPEGLAPAALRQITGASEPTVRRHLRTLAHQGVIVRDTRTGISRIAA